MFNDPSIQDSFLFLTNSMLKFNSIHSFPVRFFFFLVGGCGLTKLLAYMQLNIVPRGTLCRVLEALHGIAHFPGVLSPIGSISLGYPQF